MADTIRLFVAATLPPALTDYVAQQVHHYEVPAVRLVPVQNMHLTLFFIGEVPQQALPGIRQQLADIAQQHEPFVLELETLEPGPKPQSPRLVWARFGQSAPFEKLSLSLTEALAQQPSQKLKPVPHVTIARFRKDQSAPKHLPTVVPHAPVALPVTALALWQSRLASPHPEYTVLESFPLG